MADAERAKVLALIALGMILALLYALGGLSLYLRARYLGPTPPGTFPPATPVPEVTRVRETATPTLFPTLTMRPEQALVVKAESAATATPTRGGHRLTPADGEVVSAGATATRSPWARMTVSSFGGRAGRGRP